MTIGQLRVTVNRTERCNLLNGGVFSDKFSFSLRVHLKTNTFMYNRRATLVASVRNGHKRPEPEPPCPTIGKLFKGPAARGGIRAFTGITRVVLGKTS